MVDTFDALSSEAATLIFDGFGKTGIYRINAADPGRSCVVVVNKDVQAIPAIGDAIVEPITTISFLAGEIVGVHNASVTIPADSEVFCLVDLLVDDGIEHTWRVVEIPQ